MRVGLLVGGAGKEIRAIVCSGCNPGWRSPFPHLHNSKAPCLYLCVLSLWLGHLSMLCESELVELGELRAESAESVFVLDRVG